MRRRAGPLASAVPRAVLPAPSRRASPGLREPELGEAGNEWGPEGWGHGGAGPPGPGGLGGWDGACPRDPGRESEAQLGRLLPGGAERKRRGPGRGPRRALGAPHLRDVMFLPPSGSATDPLLAQAPLGPVTSGWPKGGPLRTGRGAEPAGRTQTPLQAWGSQRLCSRPPSPVSSSSSPALRCRRRCDVTPRDARRYFLLPSRRGLSGGW